MKKIILLLLVLSSICCVSSKKTTVDKSVTDVSVSKINESNNDSMISNIIHSALSQILSVNNNINENSRMVVYDTIRVNGEQLIRYTLDHNIVDKSTSQSTLTAESLDALIKGFNNKYTVKIDSIYKHLNDIKTTEQKKTDGYGWLIWLSIGVGIPVVIYFLIKSNIFVKIFSKIFV